MHLLHLFCVATQDHQRVCVWRQLYSNAHGEARVEGPMFCACVFVVAVRIGAAAGVTNTASANTADEGTATEPPAVPINTGNDALVSVGQSNGARSSTNDIAGVADPGSTDPDNNSLPPLSDRNRRSREYGLKPASLPI